MKQSKTRPVKLKKIWRGWELIKKILANIGHLRPRDMLNRVEGNENSQHS